MTFVYFPCEFYRISNAIAYKTLILNYNSEFNLGICFFSFTYSDYDFSNLILYVFNFKKKIIWPYGLTNDPLVEPMTQLTNRVNVWSELNKYDLYYYLRSFPYLDWTFFFVPKYPNSLHLSILNNIDSLFHRVFKAKFFPNCSILNAKESKAGSYAWNSILKGRDVILEGAYWRVGDGKSIKIWQHYWLHTKHPTTEPDPWPQNDHDSSDLNLFISSSTRKNLAPRRCRLVKCWWEIGGRT